MKFGGTSVADATRILNVAAIVEQARERQPAVVVSALGGVTDLLCAAIRHATGNDLDALDPLVADIERRHRWAVAGSIDDAGARHVLSLEMDRRFEDLRRRLRSIRILGEGTPRALDALLAFGEDLSARIMTAALRGRGVPARFVDPRQWLVTDALFGRATPDAAATRRAVAARVRPAIEAGEVPITGGFVGADPGGATTTLGRGGSDTSATSLGLALDADEIQIWTDVDGMMTADPRCVEEAERLQTVTFAEAAELAHYGAKVLHPASVAPAVERQIPVRVRNSLRPELPGTEVVGERKGVGGRPVASIASLVPVRIVRAVNRRLKYEAGFVPAVLETLETLDRSAALVVCSEVGVAAVLAGEPAPDALIEGLAERGYPSDVEWSEPRALIGVVGSGLADRQARREILEAIATVGPELVATGPSDASVALLLDPERMRDAVRALHTRFFATGRVR